MATSKIHGLGVMIGEDVKTNESISTITGKMKFKKNITVSDSLGNPDWVGVSKDQWIDPAKPYKFLNHSCNPSAGIKNKLTLVALKPLKEGDEVTIDYSTIEGDTQWYMKCNCGYRYCRETIRSVQFLPKTRFKKYFPNIPSYFVKLYQNYDPRKI